MADRVARAQSMSSIAGVGPQLDVGEWLLRLVDDELGRRLAVVDDDDIVDKVVKIRLMRLGQQSTAFASMARSTLGPRRLLLQSADDAACQL